MEITANNVIYAITDIFLFQLLLKIRYIFLFFLFYLVYIILLMNLNIIIIIIIILLFMKYICNKCLFIYKNVNKYKDKSVVVVLTVWKRNNLLMQLNLIKKQTILKWMKISIIIYQNANHTNIDSIIAKWERSNKNIRLYYINTIYETGYYGRFLLPLLCDNTISYFIICDDDIIFGDRYFQNMLRVVNNGYLATRNGRYIDINYIEISTDKFVKGFYTWENDLEYDFGGHIWAGKIEWLKSAWKHPPPTIINSEDFWISAVLKKYYNIKTKVPKCPFPKYPIVKPSLCACSDISASNHVLSTIGNKTFAINSRSLSIKLIKNYYNFKGIIETNKQVYDKVKHSKTYHKNSIFDLNNDIMNKRCLYYI